MNRAAACFVYANFMSAAQMECFYGLCHIGGSDEAGETATPGSRVGAEAGVARPVG